MEDKTIRTIVIAAIAGIVILAIGLTCLYNARIRCAMEHGYEEGTVPGSGGVVWRHK